MEERVAALEALVADQLPEDHIAVICWSGDMDKLMSALTLANGGLAMGSRVSLFFTFWGLLALKKGGGERARSTFLQKLFGWMLPDGPKQLRLSRYNMLGLGAFFFRKLLRQQGGADVSQLLSSAQELGADLYICTQSMEVMGISKEELLLVEPDRYVGVGAFTGVTKRCRQVYFI